MSDYIEEQVPVAKIIVDPRVQRGLSSAKAQEIFLKLDPNALGILTLSRRKNGNLVVIDGQHRLEGVRRATSNKGTVPCHIFDGLTLEQEAELFLKLNATSKPRRIDKFKVGVTAGHEDELAIKKLLDAYGWTVHHTADSGHVQAVAAIGNIYALSMKLEAEPNLVQAVLMVIRGWGTDRFAVNAPIFEGIGNMIGTYGSRVDLDRLQQKLAAYRGGPEGLLNEARHHASVVGMRVNSAVAYLVVVAYNRGLQSKALPGWTKR